MSHEDGGGQNDDRQRGGLHADGQAADDVRRAAGLAVLGDALRRRLGLGRVVLGDQSDQQSGGEAGDRGQEDTHVAEFLPLDDVPAVTQEVLGREVGDDQHHSGRGEGPQVQGMLRVSALLRADQQRGGQGDQDAETGEQHRQQDEVRRELLPGQGRRADAQHERSDNGAHVGLEQVGPHAGDVADVVADVVGDHRRIARIVLGNPGLDLAHQVGADVGRLRVDAAADPGEQGDRGSAEREAGQHGHHLTQRVVVAAAEHRGVEQVQQGQAEDAQAHDRETHHGAARESNGEGAVQARAGGGRGAHVGRRRHPHAEEPGKARTDGAPENRQSDQGGAAGAVPVGERQQGRRQDDEDGQDAVLTAEERHRPVPNVAGDLRHRAVSGVLPVDPPAPQQGVEQGRRAAGGQKVVHRVHYPFPLIRCTRSS